MTTPFHFCASLESLPENTPLEAVLKLISSANIDGRKFTNVDLAYDPSLYGSSGSIAEQAKYVADLLKFYGLRCRNVYTPFPHFFFANQSECYPIMRAFADTIDFGQHLIRLKVRDQSTAHIIVRTPSFRSHFYEVESEEVDATAFFAALIQAQYYYLLECHTESGMIISPVDYCGEVPLKEIDKNEGRYETAIEHLVDFLFEETQSANLFIQFNFSSVLNTCLAENTERSPDAIAQYFGYVFERNIGSFLDICITQFSEFSAVVENTDYRGKWRRGETSLMPSKSSILDLDAISKVLASVLKSSGFESMYDTLTWTFYEIGRETITDANYWNSALATLTGMEKSMQSVLAGS